MQRQVVNPFEGLADQPFAPLPPKSVTDTASSRKIRLEGGGEHSRKVYYGGRSFDAAAISQAEDDDNRGIWVADKKGKAWRYITMLSAIETFEARLAKLHGYSAAAIAENFAYWAVSHAYAGQDINADKVCAGSLNAARFVRIINGIQLKRWNQDVLVGGDGF